MGDISCVMEEGDEVDEKIGGLGFGSCLREIDMTVLGRNNIR